MSSNKISRPPNKSWPISPAENYQSNQMAYQNQEMQSHMHLLQCKNVQEAQDVLKTISQESQTRVQGKDIIHQGQS